MCQTVEISTQKNSKEQKYLTAKREINTGNPKYDALFGINGHFSVCP